MKSSNGHILIVDDIPSNIKVLRYSLRKAGYAVTISESGPDALAASTAQHFDLILLDVMMPGMDGYEVCKKLKANSITKDIPVIFLTAKSDAESLLKGFELGAVDFVNKPVKSPELLARVKTHVALQQATRELEAANLMKDKLMSVLAHDLRGPVGNFGAAIEMLLEDFENQDKNLIRQTLEHLRKSASDIMILLQNLLEWSRNRTQSHASDPLLFDLSGIISENISLLADTALQKNIRLHYQPQKIKVFADRNMISSVLRNLISNAIKFSNPGSDVNITASENNETATVKVGDSGIGIDPDKLKTIFSPDNFHSTWGTANEKGSGLGLKLCADFIRKNYGSIKAESQPGKGSVFTFTLPLNTPTKL